MEDTHPLNEPINHQSNLHQEQETGNFSESVDHAITLTPTTCPYLFLELAVPIAITTGMRRSEVESLGRRLTLNHIDTQLHPHTGPEAESVHAAQQHEPVQTKPASPSSRTRDPRQEVV
jgi:hypothetical protein